MNIRTLLPTWGGMCLAALAALLLASPGKAATVSGQADSTIWAQLSITEVIDLNYGQVIPDIVASEVRIGNNVEVCNLVNNVILVGNDCRRGEFLVTGQPEALYLVTIDEGPYLMTQAGGPETMEIDRVRVNGVPEKQFGIYGEDTIYVGARLLVGANQAPGIYQASFTITVEYR